MGGDAGFEAQAASEGHGAGTIGPRRLVSLDAFRGLTIALMILVNSPGNYGAVYSQLRHASWNGWTFADTVFPSFLFIVGVSLVFSLSARLKNGVGIRKLEAAIVRRTVILFALGLFLNTFPIFHLSTLRVPGVLQRIALCYFFAAAITLRYSLWGRVYWLIALLSSYWIMMRFIPVPGLGAGVMEPGQNFAAYFDSLFLGGHMWSYYGGAWDPEGIVSTLPAIATTLFGVLTAEFLRSSRSGGRKTAGMLLGGLLLIVLGLALDRVLPINKSLWTSSFAIFMAGLSVAVFGLFYWMADVRGFSGWVKPLVIFGLNPISIYVLSIVLDTSLRFIDLSLPNGYALSCRSYLFQNFCVPVAAPENASLLYALGYLATMFSVAWGMWKLRIFIRI